ncbi:ArsC/Spx/MgsR family protein [Ammoniphilus sp. YIM 78166]|uniref:ArsC/Spx/MgsR family protein n=1 Tax=Ammoniphilus sp. YIM 78166 TaxID=1644106 RepID=UPI00106FE0E8|nr:ArsC/Spx/MgsR family protein [Ammoniphilus sp. YIM 78166]
MIKEAPSKEVIAQIASEQPNGAKGLLSPIKVEQNDPYYVAHIKGQEDQLTDEQYIDLFHRFPDLLKKPILLGPTQSIIGFNEDKLNAVFCNS